MGEDLKSDPSQRASSLEVALLFAGLILIAPAIIWSWWCLAGTAILCSLAVLRIERRYWSPFREWAKSRSTDVTPTDRAK